MLTAHFLLIAREKTSLDKSLQIHAKSWKIILNPEGCSYRRLYKQGNEGRKKKKIVNNKHLSLINLYLPEQRRPACTASFDRRLRKFIPFSKQNLLIDLELKPFLSGNLSFSNKLISESVFLWVITRSFMYSVLKSFMLEKWLRGNTNFPLLPFQRSVAWEGREGGNGKKKKFAWGKGI